jgi:hypothetical protein
VYTAKRSPLARLRAYHRELIGVYLGALRRRDVTLALRVFDLRRRVRRSILIREEWNER